MVEENEEGYLNMEDSEARDTTASEGAPDPETDQGKKSSAQTGHSIPNEAAQGGDGGGAGGAGAGGGASGATGGSTGDAGGASQGGGSTGDAGGASQGGGSGN